MYILHIETATSVCSSSLSYNGKVIASRWINDGNKHAELLATFIQQIFDEAKTNPKDISAVSVSIGPGSYTGLRIGLSMAKGICYSCSIPLITINSLLILGNHAAQSVADKNTIVVPMIDAGRMEVYAMFLNGNGEEIKATCSLIVDESTFSEYTHNKLLFVGNGSEKLKSLFYNHKNINFCEQNLCDANHQAEIATEYYKNKIFADLAYVEPFYFKEYNPLRK